MAATVAKLLVRVSTEPIKNELAAYNWSQLWLLLPEQVRVADMTNWTERIAAD